jgi:hypothetical protein
MPSPTHHRLSPSIASSTAKPPSNFFRWRSSHGAVRQRLPAPDLDAGLEVLRNEARLWIFPVDEVGDQRRADEDPAILELERRHLAEGIGLVKLVGLPEIDDLELVLDTLLEQHHADLAGERAGG